MPLPRKQEPLPDIPHLPVQLRWLAEAVLTCPQASPDYLFLLADALDEAAMGDRAHETACASIDLAIELRRRAPSYA